MSNFLESKFTTRVVLEPLRAVWAFEDEKFR